MTLQCQRKARLTSCARGAAGYTLIEVLIVLFIISIVTTVTILTIGRNENRDMEIFAKEVTQMVSLAEEQAMLEPNVFGISFAKNSIQFATLGKDAETQKSIWLPLDDHVLGAHPVPDNIQISLQVTGDKVALNAPNKIAPQIVISTNGDVTPFVMYVGKKGKKPQFAITADADGNVYHTSLS